MRVATLAIPAAPAAAHADRVYSARPTPPCDGRLRLCQLDNALLTPMSSADQLRMRLRGATVSRADAIVPRGSSAQEGLSAHAFSR
jgi:hypothetical protein